MYYGLKTTKCPNLMVKSGIVVVYSPNNGDFRRFQSKLTKIDVKKDVKWRPNKKTNIVGIKWPLVSIKLWEKPIKSGIGVTYSPKNGEFIAFCVKIWIFDVTIDFVYYQSIKLIEMTIPFLKFLYNFIQDRQ